MIETGAGPDPQAAEAAERRAHVLALRARKLAEAEAIGLDARYISDLVDRFYGRIQGDALLGPIFAERISDWDTHLDRMKRFWRSILHSSGEYSGNPMVKHFAIPGLEASHFAHWLELFYATLRDDEASQPATELVGQRARMIADSLLTGIELQRSGISGGRAGAGLPHV